MPYFVIYGLTYTTAKVCTCYIRRTKNAIQFLETAAGFEPAIFTHSPLKIMCMLYQLSYAIMLPVSFPAVNVSPIVAVFAVVTLHNNELRSSDYN